MARGALGCIFVMVLVAVAAAGSLPAQPLNGTFTCANGNPGSAFDYGDIGAFFDALEAQGINGPVTLNVFDDGGPFVSTPSYALGCSPTSPTITSFTPVAGLSLTSPLTIQAAPGEHPVITGVAQLPNWYDYPGTLTFCQVGFTTVEGLEIRGSSGYGINWFVSQVNTSNFRIARCRIHDIALSGLQFLAFPASFDAVVIENNMIWDCFRAPTVGGGVIYATYPGVEWIIRHNTIIHSQGMQWASAIVMGVNPIQELTGNAFYLDGTLPYFVMNGGSFATMVQSANYNVYRLGGMSAFAGAGGFAAWQAAGYDVNGLVADPLLVNTSPGNEDLHLQQGSPCIDLVPNPDPVIDIDGDARPFGPAGDAGADEAVYFSPAIAVEHATQPVTNAGAAAVGNVHINGETRQFTIHNNGAGALQLTASPPVALALGANCGACAVTVQPPATIAPAGSAVFTVLLDPAGLGPFDVTIAIASNDTTANPFVFSITGTGVDTSYPAQADPDAGSGFAGPTNGPFTLAVDPGDTLQNARIVLSDLNGDAVTVTAITPMGTLTGVNTPAIPPPGQPLMLTWTGVVNPANPPGAYTWTIEFFDAGLGTPVQADVVITLSDTPPVHAIANAASGNGSAANPYTGTFYTGDGSTPGLDVCSIVDANAGQSVNIMVNTHPGNPQNGVGFTLMLNAGVLHAAPAGMLTADDLGTHNFTVLASDGTTQVAIAIALDVTNPPPPPPLKITTITLPDGTVGTQYTRTIQATGGTGAITFTLASGTLPPGVTLNPHGISSALLDGTPTAKGSYTFTLQADDTQAQTTTQAYTVTIHPKTDTGGDKKPDGGNGCATAGVSIGSGLMPVALLLALAGLAVALRRRLLPA